MVPVLPLMYPGIDALTNDRGERSGAAEVLYGVRVVARIELDDLRRGTAGTAEILKRQTVARLCGDCGRWSAVLVEQPIIISTRKAFLNVSRVTMSRGLRSSRTISTMR